MRIQSPKCIEARRFLCFSVSDRHAVPGCAWHADEVPLVYPTALALGQLVDWARGSAASLHVLEHIDEIRHLSLSFHFRGDDGLWRAKPRRDGRLVASLQTIYNRSRPLLKTRRIRSLREHIACPLDRILTVTTEGRPARRFRTPSAI